MELLTSQLLLFVLREMVSQAFILDMDRWGSDTGVVDRNRLSTKYVNVVYQANGNVTKANANGKHHMRNGVVNMGSNGYGYNAPHVSRVGRPHKKRKCDVRATSQNVHSVAPAFDARKLLIDKARTVIRKKLEEMRLASA
ncbi:hypothetical protein LguiA_022844 [Lonicera macranthoides]